MTFREVWKRVIGDPAFAGFVVFAVFVLMLICSLYIIKKLLSGT